MKNNLAYRIRKLRESKDYSQQNMADELKISHSAYSKIERAVTDPSVGRIKEIAEILGVPVTYFFQEENTNSKTEEPNKSYGFATKNEMEELASIVNNLKREVDNLKINFQSLKAGKKKK